MCYVYLIYAHDLQFGVLSLVKIPPKPVNGSSLFKEIAGALLAPVTQEELAGALDCSPSTIRAALRDPKAAAFRNPPGGWEVTVRRLLEARAGHFIKLAQRLRGLE